MIRNILIAVVVLAVLGGGAAFFMKSGDAKDEKSVAGRPLNMKLSEKTSKGELWSVRCDSDKPGSYCEVFQRLIIKDKNQRLLEFAFGYPKGAKSAQAVVIIPLGGVIAEGIAMRIDAKEAYKATIRTCRPDGCYSIINLPDSFVDQMKIGTKITVAFQDSSGKPINVELLLKGFANKLMEIKN